ncbi:adenylate kinase isoenzyme 1 isoform X1 [Diabrotica virgifera virgifera]|uniref:adenylate kinase n=1 Tax=Diabrotica virgifera virgifera TaxID=50390 RepID=A0A6P7F182_DIAVI|nr:adenylate kinase isoenzyme 1 isoform X1 [Diabrotica virgifera virgifera]
MIFFKSHSAYFSIFYFFICGLQFLFQAPIPALNVPIVWILGGPGSGKGTQCDKIVEKYGFTHLSSGDLLRAETESGSERGKELSAIMERGELVPMQIVLELIRNAIVKALPTSKGFLIDGYPRERDQGVLFEENVAPVNMIIFFEASEQTLTDRLLGRAKTSGRVDDNLETIKKRLNTFNTYTNAILEHYATKLIKINAERTTDEIFAEVTSVLDTLVA